MEYHILELERPGVTRKDRVIKKRNNKMANPVLSYTEFLNEKISHNLATMPAAGARLGKSVDPKMAKLDMPKGSSIKKSVEPKMADLKAVKGSKLSKSVDSKLEKAEPKAKAITKSVDPGFGNLVIKGKAITKSVDSQMAKKQK